MLAVRITFEWIFEELKLHFTTVDYKRKMKGFEAPVGSLYLAAIFTQQHSQLRVSHVVQCACQAETEVRWSNKNKTAKRKAADGTALRSVRSSLLRLNELAARSSSDPR